MIHFRSVFRLTALIQLLIAVFMCIPLAMAFVLNEESAITAFSITLVLMVLLSLLVLFIVKDEKTTIKARDSYLLVTLTWIAATAFGALPLYIEGTLSSYIKCFFEIMSGFTTTGATALEVIEEHPKSILFWRSMTNWLGGMGIVVLFVAVLPFMGVKGVSIMNAESVGPTKGKLTPKVQQTAFVLWSIYTGISAAEVIVLFILGVPLFEAVTITFGTMGAAGFTPLNNSIGTLQNPLIETVIMFFMAASGVNFALYFLILRGKARQALSDHELRVYLSIITVTALLITADLLLNDVYDSLLATLRYAFFHVISVITTTGFTTVNYCLWPQCSQLLLFFLFFVGGCAGSAGGGIKVMRVSTLMSLAANSIKKRLHPSAVIPTTVERSIISEDTVLSIAGFFGAYMITGLIGAVVFSLSDYDLMTCLSSSFLFLGNVGIGMGEVGPAGNFSIFSDGLLAVASFLMLAGRLEIFTVYALFTRAFWKR